MTAPRGGGKAATVTVAVLGAAIAVVSLGQDTGDAAPRSPTTRALTVALGPDDRPAELATGFTAGPGRVVTVAHLFEGQRQPVLRVRDRGRRWRPARLLARDPRVDLALLSVPGLTASGLRIGRAGERLRVLSRPGGVTRSRAATLRRRIVAAVRAPGASTAQRRPALELDASVSAGDSGASVVTATGAVAGVVFARSRGRDDTSYAVDASALKRFLAPLRTSGAIQSGMA